MRLVTSTSLTFSWHRGVVGGFGVALEALGGKCLFVSEIDDNCRETYMANFDTPPLHIHGDIYEVKDSEFPDPGSLDLLV